MSCLFDSISSQVNSELIKLGINPATLAQKDRSAVEAAKLNGLLNFPLAHSLIDKSTAFISSLSTGVANIDTAVNKTLGSALTKLGTFTTFVSAVSNFGTDMQLFLFMFLVDSLKNQLRLRILYYQLLRFHLKSILSVLQAYNTSTYKPDLLRLARAYPYIVKANNNFIALQKAVDPVFTGYGTIPVPSRIKSTLMQETFSYLDTADKILSGDNTVGTTFVNDIAAGLNGVKLNKVTWSDWAKARNDLAIQFNQRVLAQTVFTFETLAWNASRLALLVPLPFTGLDYTAGSLVNDTTLAGVQQVKFDPTAQDTLLNNLKKAQGVGTTITAIDAVKGLAPTNILTKAVMSQIITFDADFNALIASAQTALWVFAPAEILLQTIKDGMSDSLAMKDSELTLAGKEAQWITQIRTIEAYKSIFAQALGDTISSVTSLAELEALQNAILDYIVVEADDEIFSLIFTIMSTIVQAPFSNRAMQESLVLCTSAMKLVNKAIGDNTKVLNAAIAYNPPSSAYTQAFSGLLQAMATMPPPASDIAAAVAAGEIGTVAVVINGLLSKGSGLLTALESLGSNCSADNPGPGGDGSIDICGQEQFIRITPAENTAKPFPGQGVA